MIIPLVKYTTSAPIKSHNIPAIKVPKGTIILEDNVIIEKNCVC